MTIFIIILLVLVMWFILGYNSLVAKRHRVKEAWSDIEVQLKRRYDLVPNLVEIVKGYITHEKELFQKVTEARAKAMTASGKEKTAAENQFSETLKNLFAVSENYPELKANQNFLELQRELVDTEDKIQAARRFYNTVTRDYNIAISIFPTNIIANLFGFKPEVLFETVSKDEQLPTKINF